MAKSSMAASTTPVAAGGGEGRDCSMETVERFEEEERGEEVQRERGSLSTDPGIGEVSWERYEKREDQFSSYEERRGR